MEPQCGEKLNDGRWRCLACGWTGLAVELLPRRFEGDSSLTFLCLHCRRLEGVAIEASVPSTTGVASEDVARLPLALAEISLGMSNIPLRAR